MSTPISQFIPPPSYPVVIPILLIMLDYIFRGLLCKRQKTFLCLSILIKRRTLFENSFKAIYQNNSPCQDCWSSLRCYSWLETFKYKTTVLLSGVSAAWLVGCRQNEFWTSEISLPDESIVWGGTSLNERLGRTHGTLTLSSVDFLLQARAGSAPVLSVLEILPVSLLAVAGTLDFLAE